MTAAAGEAGVAFSLTPTIGGTSMSFLTNAASSASDDGHRLAIWMAALPSGGPTATLVIPQSGNFSGFYIYGVADPFANYQAGTTSGFSTTLSSPTLSVGSYGCAVIGAVSNFDTGPITFTNNGAVKVANNFAEARGYDASTGAASVSYSASASSSLVLVGAAAFRFSI